MFSLDRWQEVLSTLGRAKLRSILTAFAVAWGIFMLVVLLGMGHGLREGAENQFADDATNSVSIRGGSMSQPWQGLPVGRRISFTNQDYDKLRTFDRIDRLTGRFFPGGGGRPFGGDLPMRVGAKTQSFDLRSVHPDHLYLEKTIILSGRFINEADIVEKRKIAVIGAPIAEFFWHTRDVVGRPIQIGGVPFEVVGVFDDAGGDDETRMAYLPVTTAQLAWNGAERLNQMIFTVGNLSVAETKVLLDDIKATLAERLRFNPNDPQAINVRNNLEQYESFQQIFWIIEVFVTAMGIATLIAGVIGVANIMLITVKERTKEIGIRKALGASPMSIVGTILQESIFLTATAGYLGLVAGVGLLSAIAAVIPTNEFFSHPQIDFKVALYANVILVISGAIAGFFPAYAAARVSPVVAMRDT